MSRAEGGRGEVNLTPYTGSDTPDQGSADFWMHFGRPLAHFGLPFGSLWLPFGSLWLPFASVLLTFPPLGATLSYFWCLPATLPPRWLTLPRRWLTFGVLWLTFGLLSSFFIFFYVFSMKMSCKIVFYVFFTEKYILSKPNRTFPKHILSCNLSLKGPQRNICRRQLKLIRHRASARRRALAVNALLDVSLH